MWTSRHEIVYCSVSIDRSNDFHLKTLLSFQSMTSENLCEPSPILAPLCEILCEPRRLWRHGSRAPDYEIGTSHCSTLVRTLLKGDTSSQWKIAIFGHPGLRNPWTDRAEIWHNWLRWELSLILGFQRCNILTSHTTFYLWLQIRGHGVQRLRDPGHANPLIF